MLSPWEQFENLIQLGFLEAAGLNQHEFNKYFPNVGKEKDVILVVSERCVSIPKQCDLLEIKNKIGVLDSHHDLISVPNNFIYPIWKPDDGSQFLGQSSDLVLQSMEKEKRRPCTTVEALAIYRELHYPNRLKLEKLQFIDAQGSRIRESLVPTLFFDSNNPDPKVTVKLIAYEDVAIKSEHSGIASCFAEKPSSPA